jgi:hypothetical protein
MRQEPPAIELADDVADHRETVIPLLLQRLRIAKNEAEQKDLIYVFEVMSRNGYLRGRTDVVAIIGDVVDDMKITPIREDSQDLLKKIRISSGVKPFTYGP